MKHIHEGTNAHLLSRRFVASVEFAATVLTSQAQFSLWEFIGSTVLFELQITLPR